jgi:hypothetical protein
MHFQATAGFLFSRVIHLLSWSNGAPSVTAIQPLISDEFCDSVRVCPAYLSVFLTCQYLKDANHLESPMRVSANCISGFLKVVKLL